MIKVLIADDDVEMLIGLRNIIKWEDYGLTISAEACNGTEALRLALECKPDCIITDITMPGISGLELIRKLKEINPSMKSIILTCHEDFNYAKEAIGLAADEYIVKYTLTKEDLIKALIKIKSLLDREKEKVSSYYSTQLELERNKYVIREKLFTDLYDNTISVNEISSIASGINIQILDNYRIIGFYIDNYAKTMQESVITEVNLLKFAVCNIIEEIMHDEKNTIFTPFRNHFFMLYRSNLADKDINQKLLDKLKEIQKNIYTVLNIKFSICIGSVYKDIRNFRKATEQTDLLRKGYFFKGQGEIIKDYLSNNDVIHTSIDESIRKEIENELYAFINHMDHNGLILLLKRLGEKAAKENYSPEAVKALTRRIVVDIEAAANRNDMILESRYISADTFDECTRQLALLIEEFTQKSEDRKNNHYRKEISDVLKYMAQNLEKDINCQTMADYVHMNSSYFSRLFKNETGLSFSDYLIQKRIERSTELLYHSNMSVEDITKAVGLENVSYFYRMYKRITGRTPGEIRRKM